MGRLGFHGVLLLGFCACGGLEIAGTYAVTPTIQADFCGGQCPLPNSLLYKITKVTSASYDIEAAGIHQLAVLAADGTTMTWTANGASPTAGCTEQDEAKLGFGQGKFSGYLNVTTKCGAAECFCAYHLDGKR